MRTFTRRAALVVATVSIALGMLPARAHTSIVIAGFQIAPGGYINGYDAAPTQQIDEGPATDGTEEWTNLDPVAHHLSGRCVARPSTGSRRCVVGETHFHLIVRPGETKGVDGLPLGTYVYGDAMYPTMRAQFRVTSEE